MKHKISIVAAQLVLIGLIALVMMEVLIALSFAYPTASLVPLSLKQYIYASFDREVIQFKRQCAVYDSEVTYTLRPGTCSITNHEYSNLYHVNSLGLRDTEDALLRPEVIFLGDSVTMGLGVDQEEAFPQVFARMTGRRALNAGISSFGTARELILLKRLDRSNLEQLVIQYWENDYQENAQFASSGALKILTAEEYERTVTDQENLQKYWPGKYTFTSLVWLRWLVSMRLRPGPPPPTDVDVVSQADAFVGALEHSPVELADVQVFVISANSNFVDAVRRRAAESKVAWVTSVEVIDIASVFEVEGARFVIDDHPTSLGHAAVATELVRRIGSPEMSRSRGVSLSVR